MNDEIIARHLFIEGHVQGVYFRASMGAEAERLGVAGWVRNLRDGRVEALVQGQPEAVAALTQWAHGGPPRARVTRVEDSPAQADASLAGFVQKKTA